jgi:tRNA(adenine34) deaminase
MTAADVWADLDHAWQEAFRQAWEALRGGNIAVGAVVTTPDGTIVSASRNRVADADGPAGQAFGSSIAHAEINALAHVPFRKHDRNLVLTTTLQPCFQCSAAIRMAPVGTVRVAGADPLWDGCHDFEAHPTPWVARRPPIPIEGPRRDELGVFGTLISRFGAGLVPPLEEALREIGEGPILDLARCLDQDALARLEVDQALDALWSDLTALVRA